MKHLFVFIFTLFVSFSAVAATASWYGHNFHGKRTASGEIFDQNKLTAASNQHKMGTYLCVTNTSNNKTVRVKVNDTGGFRKYGRSLDLSKAAAIKLGFVKQGTCQITYKEC